MKLTRIKYQEGWLYVVDGKEIKDGDSILYRRDEPNFWKPVQIKTEVPTLDVWWYKAVAQSPNLSIPNIPYVEMEEDIEQLARKLAEDEYLPYQDMGKGRVDLNTGLKREGYVTGYRAASAKKWSDEDMRKAIRQGEINEGCTACRKTDEEFLLSLQQINVLPLMLEMQFYARE